MLIYKSQKIKMLETDFLDFKLNKIILFCQFDGQQTHFKTFHSIFHNKYCKLKLIIT